MRLNRLSTKWLFIAVLQWTTNAASPPIKVALRSAWPAPPLFLEIIESAATENTTTFFPLLTALTDPSAIPSPLPSTSESIYAYAIPIVHAHLSAEPGALTSFIASLALHVSTPRIEAFYQFYVENGLEARRLRSGMEMEGCESWVDWYGEVVCDVETLSRLVAGTVVMDHSGHHQKLKRLPFDHIHPSPGLPGALEHEGSGKEGTAAPKHTAILYASLSHNFYELHTYLLSLSSGPNPRVEYILRYVPSSVSKRGDSRTYLSGYGVSLDLKKMDYLALDDRHRHGDPNDPTSVNDEEVSLLSSDELDPILSILQAYPLNETAPDATVPLTADELLKIGLHATHLLYTSTSTSTTTTTTTTSSPSTILKTLRHLSQNFPKYATALARRLVPLDGEQGLEEEVLLNHRILGVAEMDGMGSMGASGSVNMLWLNGVVIDERSVNPYALLRLLRKERALVLSLTSLGLSPAEAIDLLTHPVLAAAQSQGQGQQGHGFGGKSMVLDGLFDASDRAEEGGVIVWWNDIEKDKRYERWHPSIQTLLRPLYPGQYPSIRLNIFNVVLALDLSHSSSLSFIAGSVSSIISRNFPFRFGVVPLVESEEGMRMARLFHYLVENYGRAGTMGFLERISQIRTPVHLLTPTVEWPLVRSEFAMLTASKPPRNKNAPLDFDVIVNGRTSNENEEEKQWRSSSMDVSKLRAYVQRLRLELDSAPHGHAFVNGKHFLVDDSFLRSMQIEVAHQLQYLQEAVYTNQLTEENSEAISTFFYDLPTTSLRRNKHIYPSGSPSAQQFFNLPQLFSQSGAQIPTVFVYPESKVKSGVDSERGEESSRIPFTVYIVADLDSEDGLALVKEALESVREFSLARISFIHNPLSNTTQSNMSLLMAHLSQSGSPSKVSPNQLMQALGLDSAIVDGDNTQTVLAQKLAVRQITGGADISVEGYEAYVESSYLLVHEFGLEKGDHAVIVNGRVIGPVGLGEFIAADFEALLSYELRKRTGPVVEALENINPSVDKYDQDAFAHLVSMASSVLSSSQVPDPSEAGLFDAPPRPRQRNYKRVAGKYTAFEIGDITTALYQVGVVLDPLSEAAQKWAPLMEWLSTMPEVFVDLHINPSFYTEVPLKRFYRYNIASSLIFDADGSEHRSQTIFDDLPVDPIYTLGMDVPPAWFVRPREAMYDLDNIQLGVLSPEDKTQGMQAVFDLDFLVVEGHARDPRANMPPRGVQLQLKTGNGTSVDDTQIVATLGYFQFKTKPGVFQLEIREGRGRQIYMLESVGNEGWDSLSVEEVGNEITVASFEGLTLYPRLTRKLGMEGEDVLAEIDVTVPEPPSLVEKIVSNLWSVMIPKKQAVIPASSAQAEINIFTVASGLLYERFVSIMILSVLRNTNSSVKFWFIENFLSPSFLEFIPHLAKAYGFQYELVTYKWPSWLRPQKEKQRIIWAYKILFLDVLFPMDLRKVIFVDADQIVRADLQELVDLDLHGAPYGYTPMGDDNPDMEGFRFWKTGYWKDFLQGKPYHISALYVIDLIKFRQIAAGDILRQQYHGLSADPNSLANLDQDLPNNLQRDIPIYSLHEDWLWCETWCSKDRLHRAKTIDLCQNPLTKEPKLARARAIPEWEEYDSEIARFARKLADEGLIRSNAAAVDVNVLANAGSGATGETRVEERTKEQTQPIGDSQQQQRDEL